MLFERAVDFLLGREHRFVRDYLMMSGGILVAATAIGVFLSQSNPAADPMPTASINARTEVDPRIYTVVRSVLQPEGQSVRIPSETASAPQDQAQPGEITGSLGDQLRRVTIDPCTGESKR